MTTENSDHEKSASNDAIDPAILEELHQLESEPRETRQRFRRVYRNQPTTSNKCPRGEEEEIFYITPEYDPELERNVIYWRQIEETFQNALYIWDKFKIVYFNQDYDNKNFHPLRFDTVLEVVLDVIIENPIEESKVDIIGPTNQLMSRDLTGISDMDSNSRKDEESGPVVIATSLSSDLPKITQQNTQEQDDFSMLKCQSRKYGRGLALTKAEGGSAESQTDIGIIYLIIVEDYSKAMEWFLKAADQGFALAQRLVGSMYIIGYGVTKNLSASLEWGMKAAEQGDANGQNLVGIIYNEGLGGGTGVEKDFPRAMEWYMKAANQGYSRAQRNVGNLYARGYGVPFDYSKALEWFMKAARQGCTASHNDIGRIYFKGLGVPKNTAKALEWYQRAASQGEGYSQNNIGDMHYHGIIFSQDYETAVKWYLKSAKQGNPAAQYNMGLMYYEGSGVDEDDLKAVWWLQKAAENDDVDAQLQMGNAYHYGIAFEIDYDKAVEWYLKAAKQGCNESKAKIGSIYRYQMKYFQAIEWFTEAAKSGDSVSMFKMGEIYHHMHNEENQDLSKAFEWYTKAAEIGNIAAQNALGNMYRDGRGVSQDYNKAAKWYLSAALQGDSLSYYEVGCLYYRGFLPLDYHKSLDYFLKAAGTDPDNDCYKYELGIFYLHGIGTSLDLTKAKEWLAKSNRVKTIYKQAVVADKKCIYFHLQ